MYINLRDMKEGDSGCVAGKLHTGLGGRGGESRSLPLSSYPNRTMWCVVRNRMKSWWW